MRSCPVRRRAGAVDSTDRSSVSSSSSSVSGRRQRLLHLSALLPLLAASAAAATPTTTAAIHHCYRRRAPAATAAAAFLRPSYPPPAPHRSRRLVTTMSSTSTTSTTLLPHLAAIRDKATVVLASKSPRRVEIMGLMGLAPAQDDAAVFRIVPSGFPEDLDKKSFPTPAEYATTNAECKAREVAARLFAEEAAAKGGGECGRTLLVIGSDTIVDRDGTILEKPDDAEHAVAMIRSLQGRQHLVHSGVAVFSSKHPSSSGAGAGGEAGLVPVARFCETARVTFCPLTEEEIWSYVRSGEPMDKAGSYGIQGLGGQMVQSVDGCFFAVMGLPMHKLSMALARLVHEGLV